jgi:regulator of protease activity HflC (stomatin/prohibitin superfamily)
MTGDTTPTRVPPAARAIMTERIKPAARGLPSLAVIIVVALLCIGLFIWGTVLADRAGAGLAGGIMIGVGIFVFVCDSYAFHGLTQVVPGEARVVQLFGRYLGTIRNSGLCWVNPFTERRPVSTRIRNYETEVAKVNDADGNPIEIAAVVVWQVEDTAQALYEVDDFARFVDIQTETAVRHVASTHPYDAHEDGQLSLRQNATEITTQLTAEIAERVAPAGVKIVESRLTRLSFAPEIAQAMLRRQQASAVVAARKTIVEGAVGMVEMALERIKEREIVELDTERKATMVSNLLVVLCSEQNTQPIVNAGSLYH